MKMKRFVALLMAACMLVSTPVMATGTNTTEVVEAVEVNETEDVTETSTEEAKSTGIVAPEDAMSIENKQEVDTTVNENELTEVGNYTVEEVENESIEVDLLKNVETDIETFEEKVISDDEMVDVIIVMEDASIIEKDSNATMNWLTKIQIAIMEAKQDSVISKIERKALDGDKIEIRYQYTWLLNGIATKVPYGAIDEIEAVSGVKDVLLEMVYEVAETTLDPYTVADGVMIGRDSTWASGYTGKGIKIAIIDTGLDTDHQNFAALTDEQLTKDSATKNTVSSVLNQLNANVTWNKVSGEDLSVDDVYYSTKVAYGFNYVDENITIHHGADDQGDHGTHVAGIAAANDLKNDEAVGVAPDAQLYVMKVFGKNGGAYTSDILASLEDALILGADVVNMSLGSPAGFTSDGAMFDEIYGRVDDTNTILAIAAGNSTTSGLGNVWGTDTNLTSNPDNSIISSPATYMNATSVASVDNVGVKSYYMETAGEKYAYLDGSSGYQDSFTTLGGESYEYVMVGNCGQTLEDFTTAGVEGKIAVVSRGITAFSEKHMLAEQAGAIACIVYNNAAGSFGMDLSESYAMIPCASVTYKDGELLAYAKENEENAVIYVSDKQVVVANPTAKQMSDFSSWGVSHDLRLEPDVTAPGGDIYSTLDGGKYGLMSGTSMASPNMAGVAALVMQYAKATYPKMTASELHTFVNNVIVSTASPIAYNDALDYSPRNQGSGLVNAYDAINTRAYLTVDGVEVAKAELGDDVAKTGSYKYNFDVVNFGTETLYYSVDTTVQTEGVNGYLLNDEPYYFMSTTPVALPAEITVDYTDFALTHDYNHDDVFDTSDARLLYLKALSGETVGTSPYTYDLTNDDAITSKDAQAYLDYLVGKEVDVDFTQNVLAVDAGKTTTVTVTIDVTEEGKEYMDTYFENGIYVEGFTKLTAKNSAVDLSLPYLAFYGDWTQAPMLDSGYYWDLFMGNPTEVNQYYHVLFSSAGNSEWYPGLNPYIDEAFDINNMSVSPNNDGYMDGIEEIYLSLLRNAETLSFTYTDANTGEVYSEQVVENVSKTYYMPAYAQIVPYVYTWDFVPYMFTDANGSVLPNGTELIFSIKAEVAYNAHESNNLFDEWKMPITVDTKAPEIIECVAKQDETTGKYYMEITMKDEVGVAAVNILNKTGTALLAQYAVDKTKVNDDNTVTVTYDVTGFGEKLTVVLGDYAFNESSYALKVDGNVPEVNKSLLYGYRVWDSQIYDDTLYGWLGIDPATAETTVCSSEYYMGYALSAAAYVGGQIVAVDANDELVAIKPGYWDERTKIASLGVYITNLAFDPSTETLYGYDKDNHKLVTIDIITGELTTVSATRFIYDMLALACTDDGVLYGIDTNGALYTIDKATGKCDQKVLDTKTALGSAPTNAQSMVYDAETGCLYWARYKNHWSTGLEGSLYTIDVKNGYALTKIGTIAGDAEVVGLITLDDTAFVLPEKELESIDFEKESVTLLVDGTETLNVLKTPWYVETEDYVWASSDETVAVVADGVVTAVGVGSATIQVETADGKFKDTCKVTVLNPSADLTAFSIYGEETYCQWISFNAEDSSKYEALTEGDFLYFIAGEYLDGYVYAYTDVAELYRFDAENFEKTKISDARTDGAVIDMAYDYKTGFMYGIYVNYYTGSYELVVIDTLTGTMETVNEALFDQYYDAIVAIAISTDGIMYLLSGNGILYTYDVENAEFTELGFVGFAAGYSTQSMTYDHNGEGLYWAGQGSAASNLVYIDVETVTALPLQLVDSGAMLASMYIVPETVPSRAEVAVEEIELSSTTMKVLKGAAVTIPAIVKPFNATNRVISWTSADESIAVVENGYLVGMGVGETTLTGTIGTKSVILTVDVLQSTGDITGYILYDMGTGASGFWGDFKDYDLSSGNGFALGDDVTLYTGEYYDGKIYGYGQDESLDTANYTFNVYKYVTEGTEKTLVLEKRIYLDNYTTDVLDMAFDYSTGTMYAVVGVRNAGGYPTLCKVDMSDGTLYKVGELDTDIIALTCTEEGTMYGIDSAGSMYEIDKETAELTDYIGETGYSAFGYNSMTYDYDTGNIYWAQFHQGDMIWGIPSSAYLLLVDPTDASVMNLGMIGTSGCNISALHVVPEKELTAQTPESTSLLLNKTDELMAVGDTFKLGALTNVGDLGVEITYVSDNTDVATVAEDGTVTAVGAGKATITVTRKGLNATCEVAVAGEESKLYVTNTLGWQTSPVLTPSKISETINLPADAGLVIEKACYNQDGYFYAVDAEGNLWKYTEDMVEITKIGNVIEQLSNSETFGEKALVIKDLEANAFTGKVYALVGYDVFGDDETTCLYEVNVETAEATLAVTFSYDLRPLDIAFTSESEVIIYDSYADNIYKGDLSDNLATLTHIAWIQATLSISEVDGDRHDMTYSKELGRIFLAAEDSYNGQRATLYVFNPVTSILTKVGNTKYDAGFTSIMFVEGTAPATGVEKEPEEIDSPVATLVEIEVATEEVTEVEETEAATEETTEVVETEAATEETTEVVETEASTEEATEVVETETVTEEATETVETVAP